MHVCVSQFLPSIDISCNQEKCQLANSKSNRYRLFFLPSPVILPHGIFLYAMSNSCCIQHRVWRIFPDWEISNWTWSLKMTENFGSSFCNFAIHYKTLDPIWIKTQFGTKILSLVTGTWWVIIHLEANDLWKSPNHSCQLLAFAVLIAINQMVSLFLFFIFCSWWWWFLLLYTCWIYEVFFPFHAHNDKIWKYFSLLPSSSLSSLAV